MKKKISQIVLYSVLGILVVGFILTAVLKKNFAPSIQVPNYLSIGISSYDETAKYDALTEEESYKVFVKEYKNSFEISVLYALFAGKINNSEQLTKIKNEPSFNSGFVINFNYGQEQILKVNGKDYIESSNSDTKVHYKKVVFNVIENNGLKQTDFYIYSIENNVYYKLTTLANFDNLYNFIIDIPMFNI